MDDNYQKGNSGSKPYYAIDHKTGKIIPVYLPVDAVAAEAKPGSKAGNPLIDEINEQLREEGFIEKLKNLYKIDKTP